MNYTDWPNIRDRAINFCMAARECLEFSSTASGTFSFASEFNSVLMKNIEDIITFADNHKLDVWSGLSSIRSLYDRRYETSGGFGSGNDGVSNKYSVLQIIVNRIDLLYSNELKYVDKTEHALLLLDRKIFLLEDVKSLWIQKFNDSTEVDLEKLGALHFFECGIWSFKVNGQRSQTDLILQQDLNTEGVVLPLIMTEWKKVNNESDATTKVDEAVKQCETYNTGVLKPLQIDRYRFVILVSKKRLEKIEDRMVGNTKYLIRNIAIERSTPSAEARQ